MTGPGWILSTLLASSGQISDTGMSSSTAKIIGLHRHAVKGLSADSLDSVHIANAYDTFPDDRRFALLYDKNADKFEEGSPDWLHKDNFLCAFTNPQLMAQYEACYQIVPSAGAKTDVQTFGLPCDGNKDDATETTRRFFSLRDRTQTNSPESLVWGPEDLATEDGRSSLGDFFSQKSGLPVQCVTAAKSQAQHKHQFGNTSSGWKQRKDTRTIHLVNANTVQQLAEKCNTPLNPTRFRPNIVVEGWEPWAEFDWIGKTLEIQSAGGSDSTSVIRLKILSKTVRCDGVGVDPLDSGPEAVLDIPKLLIKHFPEHGPYLGVYAVIEDPGVISLGDTVKLS